MGALSGAGAPPTFSDDENERIASDGTANILTGRRSWFRTFDMWRPIQDEGPRLAMRKKVRSLKAVKRRAAQAAELGRRAGSSIDAVTYASLPPAAPKSGHQSHSASA